MATLNPSNVVNGNTIQASDIEQLYNAFGTGSSGFATITGVSITGSLNGTASTASFVLNAVSSSFASTASFVKTAQSASYVLNAVSSSFASTASFVTLAQTASYVLNAVSSSFASTASQANQLNGTRYSASLATPNISFNFIAGFATTGAGPTTTASINISQLGSKVLGTSAFVTATPSGSVNSISVNSLIGSILTFESQFPTTDFFYTVFYII
jgi:hypothetical protein